MTIRFGFDGENSAATRVDRIVKSKPIQQQGGKARRMPDAIAADTQKNRAHGPVEAFNYAGQAHVVIGI